MFGKPQQYDNPACCDTIFHMNILILNWKDVKNPEVGGAEIIIYELARRWATKGHSVTWFARGFPQGKKEEYMDGIHIIRKGTLFTTYLYAFLYYQSLRIKPDVVLDVLNTILWQTPLYVPARSRFVYINQLAREVLYFELPPIIASIAYFLESFQFIPYKNTNAITYAPSTKKDIASVGIRPQKVQLFSLGVDHSRYRPGKKSKTPLFLCVSRLVRMKRTDLVIKAMKVVLKKYPNCKLAIVGYGYQRESLGTLRDNLGLKQNVIFIDEDILFFKKEVKDKKISLMQKSWALVFPSVKEGWGMTVTECAACATPAIVSNVTGLSDSVKHNKTGIILSKNPDPEEIANAMIRIIEDKTFREKVSKNARTFSKQFTWDDAAARVLSIINHES